MLTLEFSCCCNCSFLLSSFNFESSNFAAHFLFSEHRDLFSVVSVVVFCCCHWMLFIIFIHFYWKCKKKKKKKKQILIQTLLIILKHFQGCLLIGDYSLCRSSHREDSISKGVLKISAKSTGEHLCRSLFFNKAAGISREPLSLELTASPWLFGLAWSESQLK